MKIAELFLFEKCPLNCIKCPLKKDTSGLKSKRISITKSKLVNISGGDPLSSPDLSQTIQQYKSQNKLINIYSPGYFLPTKRDSLQGVNLFLFMHSTNPVEHDLITGKKGSYEALLENIDILIKENIKPIIIFKVHKLNSGDLPSLKDYLQEKELFLWLEITPSYNKNNLSKNEINQIKYFAKGFYNTSNISTSLPGYRCIHIPCFKNRLSILKLLYISYKNLYSSNPDNPINRSNLIKSFL